MINQNNKGYTLLEFLAVLIILALILAFIVPRVITTIKNAKEAACVENRKTILSCYKRYRNEIDIFTDTTALTLKEILSGDNPIPDNFSLKMDDCLCPSGGTITFDEDDSALICSVHESEVFVSLLKPDVVNHSLVLINNYFYYR